MTGTAPRRLVVGRVVRPHGLKGELVVEVLGEVPERFAPGAVLGLGDPEGAPAACEVRAVRPDRGRILVTLAGISDRTAAEALRGALFSIPTAEARALEPGRYYPHELEGLLVVGEDGTELGVMTGVLENPANDLWVVRAGDREVLLPAVREFVLAVDLAERRIVIRPIPGLFDEP